MHGSSKILNPAFMRLLLLFITVVFCTPFTFFDEAHAYLADTENELVHYYLTPLPDNGEACAEAPVIKCGFIETVLPATDFHNPFEPPAAAFFHPPR